MRFFRKSRGIPISAVCLALGLGVVSGVYIWKPAVLREVHRQKLETEKVDTTEISE